jgi:hypothetical protein
VDREELINQSEAQRFDRGVRKILSVSHAELVKRDEQWKRDRAGKAKPGPKPKTSPASKSASQK